MAINLASKYAKPIMEAYTSNSFVKGMLDNTYSFSGVKTVQIMTPQTVPMGNYTRQGANRYGTPTEMQDIIQELTMTQDRSFALTVDKGNNSDQMFLKNAGKMLMLQIAERAVPEFDTYVFNKLAHKAGKIVSGVTLTKTTVVDRISEGTAVLDDAEVPRDGRLLYVSVNTYKVLKHSDEFMAVEPLAKKALAKGEVGEYDNMRVIKVPKSRWPSNVNFIIVHPKSATAPIKISETNLHKDPPGISGHLLEGREYYDCFVYGVRSAGIYADVTGATVVAKPTISAAGALACTTENATIHYTTDGSDPRYAKEVKTGTSVTKVAGVTVKAYATKTGCFDSEVAELTFA